jgi:DNA-binding CsgD family transcriptional regulator
MSELHIRTGDLCSLVRLLGEVHELAEQDPAALFVHMLEGLAGVVGADGAGFAPLGGFRPGSWVTEAPIFRGFTRQVEQRALMSGVEGPADPSVLAHMRAFVPGSVSTRLRRENVSDACWNGSQYGAELRRIAGVTDVLCSVAPGEGPESLFGLALYRTGAGPRFSEAERDLVHVFHEQMVRIYRRLSARARSSPAAHVAARLRPGERRVLRPLLEGLSEKEIARRLDLSRHTVHDYVRLIYLEFGVSSRAELLARFIAPETMPG